MKTLIAIAALVLSTVVHAEEKNEPIAAYQGNFQIGIMQCQTDMMRSNISLLSGKGWGPELEACQAEKRKAAKALVPDVIKYLGKNKAAIAAFKLHYIKLLAVYDGMTPDDGERKVVYEARQARNISAMKEAWTAFDLEF